jgi:MFS family permease
MHVANSSSVHAGGQAAALRPTPMAWVGLGILLLLAFVAFLDRQVISLMVGMIKTDLGVTDSHIGILQGAAFGLVYPLFGLPLGYAADRYSRRWVIFIGIVLWSLAAMGSGLAGSFSTLLAARVGVGIGEAALGPAAFSLLSDIFPRNRLATVMSIYASGSLLGAAGALAIGGAVIKWAGDGMNLPVVGHLAAWQVAFVVTGLPALVVAVLVFLIPEPRRRVAAGDVPAPSVAWNDVFAFVRQTWAFLACYTLGYACLLITTWASLAWLPAILERQYHWSVLEVGASLGLFTVAAGLPGQLANGVLVDRWFSKGVQDAHLRYYVWGALASAVCGVLAPFAATAALYLAITAPLKFLMNYGGVQQATLQVVTPAQVRGRVSAMVGVVSAVVGSTFGPSIVAFFTDHIFHDDAKVGWSLALTNGLFMPLAALLFWLGRKPMREAAARIAS